MELPLPSTLSTRTGRHTLRPAVAADLEALVALLTDDAVAVARGDVGDAEDLPRYAAALREIEAHQSNAVLVVEDADGSLAGTMQLTRLPGLSRRATTRLQVEAVRVRADLRSVGIGGAMMRWVTDVAAPALGCGIVQLTSDSARADAHRFYERLGFVPSHTGFKKVVR